MEPSRIQAVDHVNLEAPFGSEEGLVWFYTEVGRLDWAADDGEDAPGLCFRSARLELRIRFVDRPQVDPLTRRLYCLRSDPCLSPGCRVSGTRIAGWGRRTRPVIVWS